MFLFGGVVKDLQRPEIAARHYHPLFADSIYLDACRIVCGRAYPLRYWHDDHLREAERYILALGLQSGARLFANRMGPHLRARLRAACYFADHPGA